MGNWRKRTEAEIEESVSLKDYTGGYEFGPWLLWMRKMYIFSFLLLLGIGWGGGISGMMDDPNDWISYGVLGFFGVFAPTLIGYMLRREYKLLKKGIST